MFFDNVSHLFGLKHLKPTSMFSLMRRTMFTGGVPKKVLTLNANKLFSAASFSVDKWIGYLITFSVEQGV